ncbi:hypothetical protein C8F04DRAFT_1190596 [Mycena alexandri]|uniref:Uncharacterized protein n=1 Tax=Mycena alexandri TaxID=1745969 RepID=A0AAD6SJ25_9AGAR|nr:hypothetical protein C8F04DRAFT_1190596 [Mycena alexandri]
MANGTIFGENLTMPEQDRLIPPERGWITRRFDLPPHNILDTYLVPPSYKPQINFGEQCRNAKKHVKCHNKNVKWLMQSASDDGASEKKPAAPSPSSQDAATFFADSLGVALQCANSVIAIATFSG